jgi:RHS repeat-associated protein
MLVETARYTYDAAGHMTLVQMGLNNGSFTQTRTFTYSAYTSSGPWGLLSSSITPEKGSVLYTYYANGLLQSKTDAKGQVPNPHVSLWYTYDNHNRLLSINSGSNQSTASAVTSFTYDTATNGVGKMATAWSNWGFTWSYSYDVNGNVNGQTLQTGLTDYSTGTALAVTPSASYTYDPDNRLTGMVAPGSIGYSGTNCPRGYYYCWQPGPSYQYTYDAAGRATGLNQWDSVNQVWNPLTSSGTYNAAGQLTGWQEGSTALSRTYDPARGWLTNLTAGSSLNMSYAYNSGGQATSVTDTIQPGQAVTSYTYDNLDRLSTATTQTWSMSWGYDTFGNRTSQSGTGAASSVNSTLAYNASNQIITSGYSYDLNGNLTQMPTASGSTFGMAYDVFDRLYWYYTGYNGGSPTAEMGYDAFGRRIVKYLPNGTQRIYFYDPSGREVAEYTFNSNDPNCDCQDLDPKTPTASYTYFAGQRVGQWTDRVGSKRADNGSHSSYYPYGEDVTGNPTNNDTFKFAQTYRDSDSGLDYAKSRFYASGIGRFVTADVTSGDATDPQSWNLYAYVSGDPINMFDPRGHDGCDPDTDPEDCCPSTESYDPSGRTMDFEGCYDQGPPGGGGGPPPKKPKPPKFQCPPQYQAWIDAHGSDALGAGLPEANALALTSIESGWGGGRFSLPTAQGGGNDFFNLETCWVKGTPQPAPKYKYQVGWMQANLPSDSCGHIPGAVYYALVATYNSSADSFKSAAATFSNLTATDPTTFAQNAVKDGINAGKSPAFLSREQTFADCIKSQQQ